MFASFLCGCQDDCAASRSGHDGVPVNTALGCMMIYEVDTDLLAPPMLGALVCEGGPQ